MRNRMDANYDAARRLRQTATPTEQLLWDYLRDRRLDGLKFRRQHPIGGYVVDFYCHERLLAVEIDGSVHRSPAQASRDAVRQQVLETAGIRFIRLPAALVRDNIEEALRRIREA